MGHDTEPSGKKPPTVPEEHLGTSLFCVARSAESGGGGWGCTEYGGLTQSPGDLEGLCRVGEGERLERRSVKLVEAGGIQGERQSQRNHPGLQVYTRGSRFIHLSREPVMGRKGEGYIKQIWNETAGRQDAEASGLEARTSRRVLRSLGSPYRRTGHALSRIHTKRLSHPLFPARAEQEPYRYAL